MTQKLESNPTTVPYQEIPMHEVRSPEDLDLALSRILNNGLPGFVIRAGGFDDDSMPGHEERTQMVTDALNRVDQVTVNAQNPYSTDQIISNIPNKGDGGGNKGIGRLHDDGHVRDFDKTINVHTTTEGGGKVLLANSGPERINTRSASMAHAHHERMAKVISKGQVDPKQMAPEFHTTEVSAGDTVVFPLGNQAGPVVHRFDTATDYRSADATLIKRSRKHIQI